MKSIRKAQQDDLQLVNRILQLVDLPLANANLFSNFYVAELNNTIIGVIGIEVYGKFALLRSMAVVPSERNSGIATKLVETIENEAQTLGLSEIYLLTTTAVEYFLKKDYEIIDRTTVPIEIKCSKEFSSICPASSIVMRKRI